MVPPFAWRSFRWPGPLPAPAWRRPVLPPVTVTATRFAESADSLPFGVSVITRRRDRALGRGDGQ